MADKKAPAKKASAPAVKPVAKKTPAKKATTTKTLTRAEINAKNTAPTGKRLVAKKPGTKLPPKK